MSLPVRIERHTIVSADSVQERAGMLTAFSGRVRRGPWELPRHLRVACIFGSNELDLREAIIADGESVIEILCVFGSVEITVPPGIAVNCDGDAFVGEFSFDPDPMFPAQPGWPRLIIRGSAHFGAVECTTMLAGEQASQRKRRIKQARKEGRL
jgi:hypothetical protein